MLSPVLQIECNSDCITCVIQELKHCLLYILRTLYEYLDARGGGGVQVQQGPGVVCLQRKERTAVCPHSSRSVPTTITAVQSEYYSSSSPKYREEDSRVGTELQYSSEQQRLAHSSVDVGWGCVNCCESEASVLAYCVSTAILKTHQTAIQHQYSSMNMENHRTWHLALCTSTAAVDNWAAAVWNGKQYSYRYE